MLRSAGSPLDLDGTPMPMETFQDLYRVPGFKYEYWRGRAALSVQRSAHAVVAAPARRVVEHTEPALPEDVTAGPASETAPDRLRPLWLDAFVRTPDYYGWSIDDIRADADDHLDALFGSTDALHPASQVAWWDGTPVAALLVDGRRTRPLIEALFVRRDLRRRGVARALVHRTARHLRRGSPEGTAPTLCSGYLLANEGSAAWHEAVGFIELRDWLVDTHRYRCLRHNLHRGLVRDVFGAKRRAQAVQRRLNEMKAARRDDPQAHSPARWLRANDGGARIDAELDAHLDRLEALDPV